MTDFRLMRGFAFNQVHLAEPVSRGAKLAAVGVGLRVTPQGPSAPERPATPAPSPAPAFREPALFVIEEYQYCTENGTLGIVNPPVYTIFVPANATKTTYLRKTIVQSVQTSMASSALESESSAASDSLSKLVKDDSVEEGGKDTFDYGLKSSFHAEGSIGLTDAEADASLNAETHSVGVREGFRNAVGSAVNSQRSATQSALSEQQVSEAVDKNDKTENEQIETLEIDNRGNPSSRTYGIFRLGIEKLSALCLVGAKLGFYNGATGKLEYYPLPTMDDLLSKAIADPANRATAKNVILARLAKVRDYQDTLRPFLEIEGQGDKRRSRVIPNLSTEVKVPRKGSLPPKTITVPGIPISTNYCISSTEAFGAATLSRE